MKMRILVVVLLAGCSTASVSVDRPDAAAPVEDADVPDAPEDTGVPTVCTSANRSESCVALETACDGGVRYGCYGGTCPSGDAGACSIISENTTTTRYTETCCERSACTRGVLIGQQCAERDAARKRGWICPGGLKPPDADCTGNGAPLPAPGERGEYCCK